MRAFKIQASFVAFLASASSLAQPREQFACGTLRSDGHAATSFTNICINSTKAVTQTGLFDKKSKQAYTVSRNAASGVLELTPSSTRPAGHASAGWSVGLRMSAVVLVPNMAAIQAAPQAVRSNDALVQELTAPGTTLELQGSPLLSHGRHLASGFSVNSIGHR